MPRGRKRGRSRSRIEQETSYRETTRATKRGRPPQPSRQTTYCQRSRSPSSDSNWSSSRERRESKRRREIAERARGLPSTAASPRRRAAAEKSKKKRGRGSQKKPEGTGSTEPSGGIPDNDVTIESSAKTSESAIPAADALAPEPSEQAVSSKDSSEENTPEPSVPCCIPRCPWRGSDDALPGHVDTEHAGMVLSGPVQQLQVPVTDPERGVALSRVVRAFGELFAVHFRRPPKGNTVLGCVQLLGPPERACDFIYQMEVRDENGDLVDPPLQHCPLVANMSSNREFDIAEMLKEVCVAEQTQAVPDKKPTWGNREIVTIEVEIGTTMDYFDPDEETARSSPPPELSFMWM